jgi:hypothetical protein
MSRGLYEVFLVDVENSAVREFHIIARSPDSAKLKAYLKFDPDSDYDFDELDFFVRHLGNIRPEKRKPREVKLVADD